MKTEGRRQSENVEDRRGETAGGGMGGLRFPAGRIPIGRGGLGGGIGLLVLLVLAWMAGIDPLQLLSGSVSTTRFETPGQPYQETPEEAQRSAFVRVVLADTEDTWKSVFASEGRSYEEPTMVLFRDAVDSGCGFAEAHLTACTLGTVAVDDCLLARTELDGCDLRKADLRGNDLTDIQGIMSLRGAVVDEGQLAGLTAALVRELGVILAQ